MGFRIHTPKRTPTAQLTLTERVENSRPHVAIRCGADVHNDFANDLPLEVWRRIVLANNAHDELVDALLTCRTAERERRLSLKIGAPARTYTENRLRKIDAALLKVGIK